MSCIVRQRSHERLSDVADEHRLKARVGARQRDDREQALESREQVEESILAPEDHRWLEYRPREAGGRDNRLRFAFRGEVAARALRVRAQRAHVQ